MKWARDIPRMEAEDVWIVCDTVWCQMTCIYSDKVTFDIPWVWLILVAGKPTMQPEKGDVTFMHTGMQQRKVKEKGCEWHRHGIWLLILLLHAWIAACINAIPAE